MQASPCRDMPLFHTRGCSEPPVVTFCHNEVNIVELDLIGDVWTLYRSMYYCFEIPNTTLQTIDRVHLNTVCTTSTHFVHAQTWIGLNAYKCYTYRWIPPSNSISLQWLYLNFYTSVFGNSVGIFLNVVAVSLWHQHKSPLFPSLVPAL